jgi:hypothetical protein
MIFPFVLISAIVFLIPRPPGITDPQSVAQWAKCDIDRVEWFVNWKIEYKEIRGWRDGTTCLEQGYGDCKCFAAVHKEIMDNCNGWTNRIISVRTPDGNGGYDYHAVVIYVDHEGRSGYFNNHTYKTFDKGVSLDYIISQIPGGPWEYVNG